MNTPSDPSKLPVPREREDAILRLSAAFAADVLPVDELERRLDAVYLATTRDELERLTADLPSSQANPTPPVPAGPPLAPQIDAIFSSTEREGPFEVPSRLQIRSVFGNVELDLRSARFQSGVTEIEVLSVFGNVEIELPQGLTVENQAQAIFGNIECKRPTSDPQGSKPWGTVRFTGRVVFGNLEIETAKPRSGNQKLPRGSRDRGGRDR